jgi:hypothetical protein
MSPNTHNIYACIGGDFLHVDKPSKDSIDIINPSEEKVYFWNE